MKAATTRMFKRFLAKRSIDFCAILTRSRIIKAMRTLNDIQLTHEELKIIVDSVKGKTPCNFLVFGLGNDTPLWARINRRGNTVFIEDDKLWLEKLLASDPRLKAYLVDYRTQRTQWKELLEPPGLLEMALPNEIESKEWDVILVDAPTGYSDANPGRMKSIFLSSKLAGKSSDVFVHDCDREVEKVYCDRFLKQENLKAEVGILRHYHMTDRST